MKFCARVKGQPMVNRARVTVRTWLASLAGAAEKGGNPAVLSDRRDEVPREVVTALAAMRAEKALPVSVATAGAEQCHSQPRQNLSTGSGHGGAVESQPVPRIHRNLEPNRPVASDGVGSYALPGRGAHGGE